MQRNVVLVESAVGGGGIALRDEPKRRLRRRLVAQLSGHKNLKRPDSYKTASDDHQRKMSLLLSGTKSLMSSDDAPLYNQAVKASQHSFKPRENKQASSGEGPFSVFLLVRTLVKLKAARSISLSTQHLGAAVRARLSQSRENPKLSSQITQTQINMNSLLETCFEPFRKVNLAMLESFIHSFYHSIDKYFDLLNMSVCHHLQHVNIHPLLTFDR